ncbi:MAG: PilZ domain-containing protein [Labilithrix sp.]|nr:PilZ domain-containing protein [Labilithrix sp.]
MSSSFNRRREPRSPMRGAFANKFIDGRPYAVEVLDASPSGIAIRRISEPETTDREGFVLELCVDGRHRLFAWARRVWRSGEREAYRILAADSLDRARLQKFLRTQPA